jgi:hypothetical protein
VRSMRGEALFQTAGNGDPVEIELQAIAAPDEREVLPIRRPSVEIAERRRDDESRVPAVRIGDVDLRLRRGRRTRGEREPCAVGRPVVVVVAALRHVERQRRRPWRAIDRQRIESAA